MDTLMQVMIAVLRVLLPVLFETSQDTAVDANPQLKLRGKLQGQIRRAWGKAVLVGILAGSLLVLPGCLRRTVYIPDGSPVRLRETIQGAAVWVKASDGQVLPGKMDLPEGWYCLPLDEKKSGD